MSFAIWMQALDLVLDPQVLIVILGAAVFGLFIGCIPGLTATMATALLVPSTFFMPQVPPLAAIVTAPATALFSGDIPGALGPLPGPPAPASTCSGRSPAQLPGRGGLVFLLPVPGGSFPGMLVVAKRAPHLCADERWARWLALSHKLAAAQRVAGRGSHLRRSRASIGGGFLGRTPERPARRLAAPTP